MRREMSLMRRKENEDNRVTINRKETKTNTDYETFFAKTYQPKNIERPGFYLAQADVANAGRCTEEPEGDCPEWHAGNAFYQLLESTGVGHRW